MVQLEPIVDRLTARFFRLLDTTFPGQPCDLGLWLRYYATDVIFSLTFGTDIGFMENGDSLQMFPTLEYLLGDYTGIVSWFQPSFHTIWKLI